MIKIGVEYIYPFLLTAGKYIRKKIIRFLVITYGVDGEISDREENPRSHIIKSLSTFCRELGATDDEFYTAAVNNMLAEVITLK